MNQGETYFIVGANGQLGTALRKRFPDAHSADMDKLDITDKESVESFDWTKTRVILNAAAFTNVDAAETPVGRKKAWSVNATAVANLVRVAQQYSMTLVHISTDYVFDGTEKEHLETELFSPLCVYGESKAAGDIAVSLLPKYYILRTSWVIGEGKNFVRTMLDLAGKGINPKVVCDRIGRPTFTSELVRAIDYLLSNDCEPGTYNVSNSGDPVSWADLTRKIFKLSGHDELTVTDVTTEEYFALRSGVAHRPLNSVLSLKKLNKIGFSSIDWRSDLKAYLKQESAK